MGDFDTAHLVYLIVLGLAVVFWFVIGNREKLSTKLQQAMIWGLIFIGVIAAIGLWGDIRRTTLPGHATVTGDNRIELPRHLDGHYYLRAEVNGKPVDFMIDTGASNIVLTQKDADLVGLDPATLAYTGRALTANGEVRTAPVRLDSFEVGPIHDSGVAAVVNQGELDVSLLGMEYLQRYSSVQFSDGRLILTR